MDHDRYIKEVPPVSLKFGNGMFGTDRTFQQDNGNHTFLQNHRNDVCSNFLVSSTKTIGPQTALIWAR